MSELTDRLTDVNEIGPATAEKITEAFDDVAELQETVADLPDGYAPITLSRLNGFGPSRARTVAVHIDKSGVLEDDDD